MNYIQLFSQEHLLYIGFFTFFYWILLYISKLFPQKKIEIFISISILLIKFAGDFILYFINGMPLYTLFPIHVCNVSLILSMIFLVKPNFQGFQLMFYMSLGAIAAILFPEAVLPLPNFLGIVFYSTHFFILFVIIYQMKYLKYRPTLNGLFKTYIALNVLAVIAFIFNNKFSTNYMYINHKPITASPIDYFGPWPFYIIVVQAIFIFLGFLSFLLFKERKK